LETAETEVSADQDHHKSTWVRVHLRSGFSAEKADVALLEFGTDPIEDWLRRGGIAPSPPPHVLHNSTYRQKALASIICLGVRHSGWSTRGLATTMQIALAREVATFSRFALYKNSMPRGASRWLELVTE